MRKLWIWDDSDPLWYLRGFDRARMPVPSRRSLEMLPGVYSFDDTFLGFLRKLSHGLNDVLPVDLGRNKFVGPTGIHTGFDRLRTVTGYSSTPMSYTPVDNSRLLTELNLTSGFKTDRHRRIYDELYHLVFSNWKPTSVKAAKHSNFGFPMAFMFDAEYKMEFARNAYANINDICYKMGKRDFASLASDHGMVFLYNLNRRGQVDSPGKVRNVNDLEYAISGGARGRRFATDKKVVIDGKAYDDFSATRDRVVQGFPWAINCIMQAVMSGHMYGMFDMFPSTFHHTSNQPIVDAVVATNDAYSSDVSQYDETMDREKISRMFDVMADYWPEPIVDMCRAACIAGYYARPLDVNGGRGVVIGDPMDPFHFPVHAGNRSGWAGTSFTAKTQKVAETLCVIDDLFGNVVGNVASYLRWEQDLVIANNGDDEVVTGNPTRDPVVTSAKVERYRAYRDTGKAGYYVIEEEAGHAFSGELISIEHKKALPRPQTALEKIFCNERAINTVFRTHWPIGVMTRLQSLQDETKHPSGPLINEILNRTWRDEMTSRYGSLSDLLIRGLDSMPSSADGYTAIDKEVRDDPNKLHHKYLDTDVSAHVLDDIVKKLDPSEFQWAFEMYKGTIH